MCFEAHLKGREEGGDGWREGERKQGKEKGREERERERERRNCEQYGGVEGVSVRKMREKGITFVNSTPHIHTYTHSHTHTHTCS